MQTYEANHYKKMKFNELSLNTKIESIEIDCNSEIESDYSIFS